MEQKVLKMRFTSLEKKSKMTFQIPFVLLFKISSSSSSSSSSLDQRRESRTSYFFEAVKLILIAEKEGIGKCGHREMTCHCFATLETFLCEFVSGAVIVVV